MAPGTFEPFHITWIEALLRMGTAFVLPLAIGIERFYHKKPIDFRPFVIVSLAACSLSLAALEIAHRTFEDQISIDPTRVFAGVITGIGFLGAGAMFRDGGFVKGGGSAASILAAGAIGIVSGVGLIWLAVMTCVPIILMLILTRNMTDRYDAGDRQE
ncbi:MAG: MgtC/SapB family protein [Parvularcula sp.]|jgi:putative Mg2+ transporter-C (MgtC) family protein|nr:MgtC/SapB family protein [Parvularcula sp.]